MRIVCQKCSAAYAIDDKLVTPKGIRAQCPRCRHLQLVKSAEPTPVATDPGVPPFSISPGPPLSPRSNPPEDPFFDFAAPPTQQQAVKVQMPAAPPPSAAPEFDVPSDMLDFSDLGPPPPPPPPAPKVSPKASAPAAKPPPAPSLMPQSSAPFDFSGDFSFSEPSQPQPPLHKQGSSPGLRLKPKEEPLLPPSRPAQAPAALVQCRSCGKVLTDPFDQALGICDDCRSAQNSSGLGDGDRQGRPTASGMSRTTSLPGSELGDEPEAPTVAEKKFPKPPKPQRSMSTAAYRDDDGPQGGSGKVVAMAVLLLLVFGAGGAYLFVKKPWIKKPPPMAQKLPVSSARPIDAMVERWKTSYPELVGSAAEHLAAGEENLALDNSSGYAEAEVEFQKALVLDKSNDRAVAGWALALAFSQGDKVDPETQKMAEQMLVAAEQRGGDARVYVAHAHLLVVRNANLNDIKVLAERGISSPSAKDKALAYLALGQAYLAKNPQSAKENFEEALRADSKLKRAYLYQVRLMVNLGSYRGAVLTLEKRLEADPDQFEASDLLGRLYLEVGEPALAKRTYQKAAQAAPRAARPKLALAVFAYQHDGDLDTAAQLLDALIQQKGLDKQLQLDVLGHRAAVARLAGDYALASQTVDSALQLRADDPNAHLQKLFASVALGNAADARAQLPFIKLSDPGLETALEGRVLMVEGKFAEAFEKLKKAVELDPRRTDAMLLAGAAAVKAKKEDKGWEQVLAKGYRADPMQSGPRAVMAPVFVARSDLSGGAKGVFSRLGKDREDPNPHLADGVIAWHLGELGPADDAFAKVISADPMNAEAFSFRALIALKRKDVATATKLATKAVAAGRASGLAHCVLGWSQLLGNKVELSRKTLQKAVELAPNLYLARARLAEADARVKKVAEAKAAMTTVLTADPTYNEAKRVLYGIP